jgi:TetR/AcrR family transcriptional regulator, cholesterol catabolism regulator
MGAEPPPSAQRRSGTERHERDGKRGVPEPTNVESQGQMATELEVVERTLPRQSRKRDILDTFAEMVAERGYDEVSLRDIAEALGMSKGTILHHYGSKDRLLEQVHAEYMRRRLDEAYVIQERFSTAAERLAGLVFQLLLAQRDDRASTVAFAREITRFQSDPLMGNVREMRNEYFGIVRDVIQSGMDDGVFRRCGEPAVIALQMFGMCNWMWSWMRPEGRWTLYEIADTYVATFLGGLATDAVDSELLESSKLGAAVEQIMGELAERDD